MSRTSRFFIDIALFIGLLIANDPARTGLAVHEWLSIALVAPVLFHLVINWEWTLSVGRRFFRRLVSMSRLNLVIDVALFASTVAVMVSGFAVSSVLAGALGVAASPSPIWVTVHALAASATVISLLVHFALHGHWFAKTLSALFADRESSGRPLVLDARAMRNTGAVLGVTTVLAVAILLTVSGTGALLGASGSTATAATTAGASTTVRTCPRTGCTASTCHAETGQSPYAQDNSGAAAGGSSSGYSNSSASSAGTRTCPRTGCTASTCHAETGQSPYAQ
jgi:hypothetical protein